MAGLNRWAGLRRCLRRNCKGRCHIHRCRWRTRRGPRRSEGLRRYFRRYKRWRPHTRRCWWRIRQYRRRSEGLRRCFRRHRRWRPRNRRCPWHTRRCRPVPPSPPMPASPPMPPSAPDPPTPPAPRLPVPNAGSEQPARLRSAIETAAMRETTFDILSPKFLRRSHPKQLEPASETESAFSTERLWSETDSD